MQISSLKALAALLFTLLCLNACRSAIQDATLRGDVPQSDPNTAAKSFFTDHYDFYYEDPTPCKALLTPRFFRVLKREYDALALTGGIGALDCDPWMNAQDGYISKPYRFETLKKDNSEAAVRFNYTFTLGPKSSHPQSVLLKLQRSSSSGGWQLADFIMPNNESLVELFEKNPDCGDGKLRLCARPKIDDQSGYKLLQIGWISERAKPPGSCNKGDPFEDCDGENEVISLKASNFIAHNNVFDGCQG